MNRVGDVYGDETAKHIGHISIATVSAQNDTATATFQRELAYNDRRTIYGDVVNLKPPLVMCVISVSGNEGLIAVDGRVAGKAKGIIPAQVSRYGNGVADVQDAEGAFRTR